MHKAHLHGSRCVVVYYGKPSLWQKVNKQKESWYMDALLERGSEI